MAKTAGLTPVQAGFQPAAPAVKPGKILRYPATALAFMLLFSIGGGAMALEKPKYQVLECEDDFELRQYEPYIVAETYVDSDFEDAGNEGFRRLAGYIFGSNRSRQKLEMTAPVPQSSSEKIAMTAPVNMHKVGEQYRVTFMMPSDYTLETLPEPINPEVTLRKVPGKLVAAVRYSGTWSQRRYHRHQTELQSWIADQGWDPAGEAVFARYDPPFIPWFLRHNEILLPVDGTASPQTHRSRGNLTP